MPCDMKRYPKDWKDRRARILARAKNRCEKCGLRNYSVGYRDEEGNFVPNGGNGPCDAAGNGQAWPSLEPITYRESLEFAEAYNDHWAGGRQADADGNHWFVIVLTIAHAAGAPLDCPNEQLFAACQKCHLDYDKALHSESRRKTRMDRRAVGSLFDREALYA